ncbi:MAG: hypothetical protein ABWZ89_09235 [Acidimicrobiales bacterium]
MTESSDPEALARAARLAQAADARSRRSDWDQLNAEEATLGSTLERLATAGSAVRLETAGGPHHGSVTELGPDHVRLVDHGRWRYLRLSTVLSLEVAGAHDGPGPDRVARSFVEALSRLVGETVTLVLADGAAHTGTLTAVGSAIVTLARDGPAGPLYASSSAVAAALGEGSG